MAMTMTQRMSMVPVMLDVPVVPSNTHKKKRKSTTSDALVREFKESLKGGGEEGMMMQKKRARLSTSPSPTASRSSSPSPTPSTSQLSPPPTPVMSHKALPVPLVPSPPPSPPPSSPSSSSLVQPRSLSLRPSRYQHFTSPLCPSPSRPSPYSMIRRIPHHRASSPPHHLHSRYNSLLHWTLQKNHCMSVRKRQQLAPLQIYPYIPPNPLDLPLSPEEDDEDDEDEEAWDDADDGWDEGEVEYSYETGWKVVVPSQPSESIPRALTPPNSPQDEDMDLDIGTGEPVVIKEGVTIIALG